MAECFCTAVRCAVVGCQVNATTFQEWRAYMKKLDSLEGAAPARNRRCSVPRLQRATANRQGLCSARYDTYVHF